MTKTQQTVSPAESQISIKGIREGLLVTLGVGSYEEIVQQLNVDLARKQDFLKGSKMVLQLGDWPLQQHQLAEIKELFETQGLMLWTVLTEQAQVRAAARKLGLATRLPGSQTDLEGNALPDDIGSAVSVPGSAEPVTEAAKHGVLLRETLRSGRSVDHEGHVIIIGDVNPGAEIIAGGNVIVWGRLRGLVHAGALGDKTAVICALDLNPTQLRIADQIAVPPEEKHHKPVPEQALIRSGRIVAEPWQTRN